MTPIDVLVWALVGAIVAIVFGIAIAIGVGVAVSVIGSARRIGNRPQEPPTADRDHAGDRQLALLEMTCCALVERSGGVVEIGEPEWQTLIAKYPGGPALLFEDGNPKRVRIGTTQQLRQQGRELMH